jgi:hypothetical protein
MSAGQWRVRAGAAPIPAKGAIGGRSLACMGKVREGEAIRMK